MIQLKPQEQEKGKVSRSLPSWEEIVREHQQKIYNLAYYLCGNSHEADDITQETFLKAFENLEGFRQEAGLRTWLSRIATNTYLGRKRKKSRHESISLGETTVWDHSGNPERIIIRREMQWCILHVLEHHLPRQEYKVVLVLYDLNGLSYGEISEVLGISVSAVKSRLYRARQSFKNHLVKSGCIDLVKDYTCYCEGANKV